MRIHIIISLFCICFLSLKVVAQERLPYTNPNLYREDLDNARKVVEGLERDGNTTTLNAYWNVCYGDVLVVEQNLKNQDREWENASLAKELLDIVKYLEEYDYMLDSLSTVVSRMVDVIFDHPRLKLKMLEFELLLLHRIDSPSDDDLNIIEDVKDEILYYRCNIDRANQGDFDKIEGKSFLKQDPVEWSIDYENIIDEANKKVYSLLEGHPRGMGFCFIYWRTKSRILLEDYGIKWESPAEMNPHVMFD